jgi:hypothetical protein
MENLAKAIVDSAYLFGQLLDKWGNNPANVAATNQLPVGDTVYSIFGNLVSFVAQLSTQILTLINK